MRQRNIPPYQTPHPLTSTPTQNLTATPTQPPIGILGINLNLDFTEIAILAALIVVAVLLAIL